MSCEIDARCAVLFRGADEDFTVMKGDNVRRSRDVHEPLMQFCHAPIRNDNDRHVIGSQPPGGCGVAARLQSAMSEVLQILEVDGNAALPVRNRDLNRLSARWRCLVMKQSRSTGWPGLSAKVDRPF